MHKKILIAVDNSKNAVFAVRYAVRLFKKVQGVKFVLATIQPTISQFLLDEASASVRVRQELAQIMRRNRQRCQDMLENHRRDMVTAGVEDDRIDVVNRPRRLGIAMDIIDYAQNERLDAIVVGRRGMTALQEMFMGSVSSSIVQNSGVIPVWLVGGDVEPGKMLVPVDGSEFSLRAIDHMVFIVGANPEVELTLFHVQPRLSDYCEIDFDQKAIGALASTLSRGDQRCIDNFYAAARQKLADFGIDENRVGIKTVKGLINPGAEIVKEFRSVGYDTIIMGRRGINRNFFTGSVTNYVLNKMPESVIWIVP